MGDNRSVKPDSNVTESRISTIYGRNGGLCTGMKITNRGRLSSRCSLPTSLLGKWSQDLRRSNHRGSHHGRRHSMYPGSQAIKRLSFSVRRLLEEPSSTPQRYCAAAIMTHNNQRPLANIPLRIEGRKAMDLIDCGVERDFISQSWVWWYNLRYICKNKLYQLCGI